MPRRWIKSRKYGKSRSRSKRRWGRGRKRRIARARSRRRLPLAGYPKSKMVRLRYVDQIGLDPAAGSITSHYFSANAMSDPDITGGGHQPLGFDQMMVGYEHYTVLGSKIKVTYVPGGTGLDIPGYFGVILDNNTVLTYTNPLALMESKQGKQTAKWDGQSPDGNVKSITRYFSAKKFFKVKNIIGKDLYRGTSGTNPSEGAFFGIWSASIGSNNPALTNFLVEIEFIAVLTEPQFIAQS